MTRSDPTITMTDKKVARSDPTITRSVQKITRSDLKDTMSVQKGTQGNRLSPPEDIDVAECMRLTAESRSVRFDANRYLAYRLSGC